MWNNFYDKLEIGNIYVFVEENEKKSMFIVLEKLGPKGVCSAKWIRVLILKDIDYVQNSFQDFWINDTNFISYINIS